MNKIFVGVDIAKKEHFASFINSSGENLTKTFKFTNDLAGFNILEEKLKLYPKHDIVIGFESTAHYANAMLLYFFNKGYNLTMINPLKTHALRNINIRGAKNDKIDAHLIATFLRSNDFKLVDQKFIDLIELKTLTRARQDIVTSCSKAKIQLVSALDQIFPEYATFFRASVHGTTSYALLKECPSPEKIAKMHLTKLTNILISNSRNHFSKKHAEALKLLAKSSVGLTNYALELNIRLFIERIELFSKQKAEIESRISTLLNELSSPLLNLKGIGEVTTANIIAEIGDINRFKNYSKLIAFAGLDPKIRQSGNFNATSVKMSKRGSRQLRYSLIFACENLVRNTSTFAEYYSRKRDEGKSHYQALGHCAGKFIRIIYRVLKDNTEFTLI